MLHDPTDSAEVCCPITHQSFSDPVVALDGFSYERAALTRWFQIKHSSPMTSLHISPTIIPNRILKVALDSLSLQACRYHKRMDDAFERLSVLESEAEELRHASKYLNSYIQKFENRTSVSTQTINESSQIGTQTILNPPIDTFTQTNFQQFIDECTQTSLSTRHKSVQTHGCQIINSDSFFDLVPFEGVCLPEMGNGIPIVI